MSTIVMRVDLDCDRCYKKIRKLLCKLQGTVQNISILHILAYGRLVDLWPVEYSLRYESTDRENIKTISYDEKNNTVTVSGSFDAEEVADRLCSGAGKVITDIQVARGNQMMPGGAKGAPPKHHGKENHGHGQKEGHGYGGGHGQKEGHGYGGGHGQKESHGYGGGHGGGGGKPDKTRHVKFDMVDDEEFDQRASHHGKGHGNDQGKGHGHGHGQGHGHPEKPRVFTTTAMSRNEAPRPQQQASMAPMRMPPPGQSMPMMPQGMAPMRMPTPGPSMTMMPQAISTPSIWPAPAAPELGYSAPAYGYGGGPPAGGYYGAPVYDGGYGTYGGGAGAYGRNPYQLQYYEEPSPGCSVM